MVPQEKRKVDSAPTDSALKEAALTDVFPGAMLAIIPPLGERFSLLKVTDGSEQNYNH